MVNYRIQTERVKNWYDVEFDGGYWYLWVEKQRYFILGLLGTGRNEDILMKEIRDINQFIGKQVKFFDKFIENKVMVFSIMTRSTSVVGAVEKKA